MNAPAMPRAPRLLHASRAWLDEGGWADDVLLEIGGDGCWQRIETGVAAPPPGATRLPGPALPGLVDAHSHAFQRAFAGLAERLEPGHEHDDFWSWRGRMYDVASRIEPDTLRAIAGHLYAELLCGGYTHVCEFHYLQHRRDGTAYDDPLALAWALADAAADTGIGLTLLPVVYERGGFGGEPLGAVQRRFAMSTDAAWQASRRIAEAARPRVDAGVAIHSLRAASPESIAQLAGLVAGHDVPIHIHVAEQVREVEQCLAATGKRPIEWLAAQPGLLDARWQLVHATHATRDEIDAVAAAGAGIVLCPSTEANLGDGICDLPGWLDARGGAVSIAIGSDSHIGRDALEELRWLEYGQRLALRRRVVAAGREAPERGGPEAVPSAATRLWLRAQSGGAAAAGRRGRAGIRLGARADLLVADAAASSIAGIAAERTLDALIFSSPAAPWREVWVAGVRVVEDGRHVRNLALRHSFEAAMEALRA